MPAVREPCCHLHMTLLIWRNATSIGICTPGPKNGPRSHISIRRREVKRAFQCSSIGLFLLGSGRCSNPQGAGSDERGRDLHLRHSPILLLSGLGLSDIAFPLVVMTTNGRSRTGTIEGALIKKTEPDDQVISDRLENECGSRSADRNT